MIDYEISETDENKCKRELSPEFLAARFPLNSPGLHHDRQSTYVPRRKLFLFLHAHNGWCDDDDDDDARKDDTRTRGTRTRSTLSRRKEAQ